MLKLFRQVRLTWHATGYARPHALPKSRKPVKVLSNNLTLTLDPDGGGLYLMRVERHPTKPNQTKPNQTKPND